MDGAVRETARSVVSVTEEGVASLPLPASGVASSRSRGSKMCSRAFPPTPSPAECPDDTGNDRGRRQTVLFGKLWHKKAPPADFFTEHSRSTRDDADRCRKQEVEGDRETGRHRPEP